MKIVNSEKPIAKRFRIDVAAKFFCGYWIFAFLLLCFNFLLFTTAASAQDDPIEAAPPPLKIISKDELTRLDGKTDIKDRTKLSLELMNLRLAAAEKLSTAQNFEAMYLELGYFHALMDDALAFLNKRYDGRGKVLDNFKRLEIALRGMAPKIEIIRRELPLRFDPYVRKLMGYLRSVRAQATDSLFSDSVIPTVRKPD
ncbi:MAG: hypothetical protein ABL999_07770 [Pyrinomonadaceae bacterium]